MLQQYRHTMKVGRDQGPPSAAQLRALRQVLLSLYAGLPTSVCSWRKDWTLRFRTLVEAAERLFGCPDEGKLFSCLI
jgi:hypothetical protein